MTLSSLLQTFLWHTKVHGITTTTSGYPVVTDTWLES
jgi:hypothetical protein